MNITIKPLSALNADEAIDCIITSRGKDYYKQEYYNKDFLLDSDFNKTYAAHNESGKMTGIICLSRGLFDDSISVISTLNVCPKFTGMGIGRSLIRFITDIASKQDITCMKGQAVTTHALLQRFLEDYGLRPTGFLFGARSGKNLHPPTDIRNSLVILVRKVTAGNTGRIYVHSNISGLASSIYNALDVEVELISDKQKIPELNKTGILEYIYDEHDDILYTQVIEYGADTEQKLNALTDLYCDPSSKTAITYINMRNPSAIHGYESMLNSGWFFSGFYPLGLHENMIFSKTVSRLNDMEMTERVRALYEQINL